MNLLVLWPALVLIAVTLAAGVIAGVIADAALAMRDLRRAGLDREPAATRPEQR